MNIVETKYYIDINGTYLGGWDVGHPEGAIEVSPHPDYADQVWQFPGWGQSLIFASQGEEVWRTSEMLVARENRIAIAEMGDDSIPGTAKQWQDYWIALRDWKEGSPDYPDVKKRPLSPGLQ